MHDPETVKDGLACHASRNARWLHCSECGWHGKGKQPCAAAVPEAAVELIDKLRAQVPKWISVCERLPETTGYYLCYVERYDVIDVIHYSTKNKAFNSWDENFSPDCVIAVTHWMPLPEPPKDDDNADQSR